MAVVRTILTVLFFVIGAIIVILAFMQTKEDAGIIFYNNRFINKQFL